MDLVHTFDATSGLVTGVTDTSSGLSEAVSPGLGGFVGFFFGTYFGPDSGDDPALSTPRYNIAFNWQNGMIASVGEI